MKQVNKINNKNIYIEITEMTKIANQAVQQAKQGNMSYGIPETFIKNGKLYFVLPDGEILSSRPGTLKQAEEIIDGEKPVSLNYKTLDPDKHIIKINYSMDEDIETQTELPFDHVTNSAEYTKLFRKKSWRR